MIAAVLPWEVRWALAWEPRLQSLVTVTQPSQERISVAPLLHLRQLSMLVSPREDAGEAQHTLPCQASASALFPNNAGIAFLLRRRTSSRMWSTPCCKPTGPQGCRCWKATSWYSSHLAPRPRDTGMGGGSQPFYQGTLLAACLSEAKRATENKSWKLNYYANVPLRLHRTSGSCTCGLPICSGASLFHVRGPGGVLRLGGHSGGLMVLLCPPAGPLDAWATGQELLTLLG